MITFRERVTVCLAGLLTGLPGVHEAAGGAPGRFDVRGTVVDSGGRRVGDALVVLVDNGDSDPVDWSRAEHHRGAHATRTDPRGEFLLSDMLATTYWLYARGRNGQAHLRRIGFYREPPPPYDVRLSRTELEGTVYRQDGRTPVADVIVGLDYEYYVTRTNELGKFRFAGLEPKVYDVFARAPLRLSHEGVAAAKAFARAAGRGVPESVNRGFQEIVMEAKVTVEPDRLTKLTVRLPAGVVRGVVRTGSGVPAAGVRVGTGQRAGMTDHAGRFELTHVPAGPCALWVEGRNLEHRRLTVDVRPGGDPTLAEITLYPFRPQVIFHFVTPEGAAITKATIRLAWRVLVPSMGGARGGGGGGLTIDDQGQWRDSWMDSGAREYAFYSAVYGYAERTVVVDEGVREVHHDITMMPGGSICGTTRDALTGAPVGGIVVRPFEVWPDGTGDGDSMWNAVASGGIHGSPISEVSRDGDGSFCLANLPPGTYRLALSGAELVKEVTLNDAQEISGLEIIVPTALAQRWIGGRLVGPDNAPVGNMEATFILTSGRPGPGFGGGARRRARTDDTGAFRVGPVSPHDWRLRVLTPGRHSKTIPVDLTDESVDVGDVVLTPVEGS